jgi:N4-gp56 family major capsid protein
MANTNYGVNDPLAVKLWSKRLAREALKETWAYKFMGDSDRSLIQIYDDTRKSAGDRITIGLRMQLNGEGVIGDGTLEGNEEALVTYSDNLLINQQRNAVRVGGRIDEQRVNFDIREEARIGLQDWWADRFDTSFMNQITGNSGVSTAYSGLNAAPTYTDNNRIFADNRSSEAAVCSASASAVFKLSLIDTAKEIALTNSPEIRPLKVKGEDKYVMFLHPYQVTAMRTNTDTGQWLDIQKAAIQGGQIDNNPIYNGALGEYNGVILHSSTRIPRTTNAADFTTVNGAGNYRAVLCGAQACALAFGRENGPERATWYEEKFDYGNQFGVSAGFIYGLKKLQFNSQDFSTIVVNTFASRATT